MQAIILAAGMGKRLGDLTQSNTKCMIKVNEVTLIERMLKILDEQQIEKIIIVIGYYGEKLIDFINGLAIKVKIEFINNPIYDITNNIYSLYLAKEYLLQDDTILLESDLIFDEKIIKKILENPYPNLALVAKYESWMDGTVVKIDVENNIKQFISSKSFLFEEIPSYFKTVNIYKFSKSFSTSHYVPFLEAYSKALGNNEYYEQVLRVISLLEKPELKALPLEHEDWYEIDDIQDLDIAESVFSRNEEKFNKMNIRYGGYWRYQKLKDFCYLVNPFFPNQRLMDEIKTNFEKLVTQYPSGQVVNSLLASKMFNLEIEQIVVGNGASELIQAIANKLEGQIGVILPSFEEYAQRLKNKAKLFVINDVNFYYGVEYLKKILNEVNGLILINPDNPSGNYIRRDDIDELLKLSFKENKKIIIDESFIDFSDEGINASLLNKKLLNEYPNLIVVKSISKSYGIPGMRLGVVASGDEELIAWLKKEVSIWNINSIAEFFMQIFGKYENEYKKSCLEVLKEREFFYEKLTTIEYLRVIKSQANYFLCEVLNGVSAERIAEILLDKHKILIKNCTKKAGFDKKQFIRISIKNRHDNAFLLNALKEL